jgi:hypothetical protein
MLREGRRVVVLSDAGMPTISDPGFRLMRDAIAEKIEKDMQSLSNIECLVVSKTALKLNTARCLQDAQGLIAERLDAQANTTYFIRPDQHVAARWRAFNVSFIEQAWRTATAQ